MRMFASLSVAVALFGAVSGCGSKGANKETYANEWKAIAEQYKAVGEQNNAAPLPDTRGLPREERVKILGERVIQDGSKYDPLVTRARDLNAPKGYEDHKAALVNLVEGTARLTKAYGKAIQSGNRAESDAAGQALDQHLIQGMDRLISALKGLGIDTTQFQKQRDEIAASLKG